MTSRHTVLLRAFLPAAIPSGLLIGVMTLGVIIAATEERFPWERRPTGSPLWMIPAVALVCVGLVLYFLPTSIAAFRQSRHYWGILIANALGFLSGIPWLIALIWSVLPTDRLPQPSVTYELDRLTSLHSQGLISEEEFTAAKKRLLS